MITLKKIAIKLDCFIGIHTNAYFMYADVIQKNKKPVINDNYLCKNCGKQFSIRRIKK